MAGKKKKTADKKGRLWTEAKQRCRLNTEGIRMAKEMGINPRSLIKNIPSKSQQWKAPVKEWIHDIYEKRQKKAAKKKARKERAAITHSATNTNTKPLPQKAAPYIDEDIAFEDMDDFPNLQGIHQEDQLMLRRQEQFRIAADMLQKAFQTFLKSGRWFSSARLPLPWKKRCRDSASSGVQASQSNMNART